MNRTEGTQFIPCGSSRKRSPVMPHHLGEVVQNLGVIPGITGRIEGLAHPLHAPLTVGDRALGLERTGGRTAGIPRIDSGSAGLGSRDVTPADIVAVADNLVAANPKRYFVLGIDHPYEVVSNDTPSLLPQGAVAVRFQDGGQQLAVHAIVVNEEDPGPAHETSANARKAAS